MLVSGIEVKPGNSLDIQIALETEKVKLRKGWLSPGHEPDRDRNTDVSHEK